MKNTPSKVTRTAAKPLTTAQIKTLDVYRKGLKNGWSYVKSLPGYKALVAAEKRAA